jgi:DNA polymerase-3 subunit gamma/tau
LQLALTIYDEILDKGFDGQHFLSGLSKHFRDLLVSGNEKNRSITRSGCKYSLALLRTSKKCQPWFIFDALKTTNDAEINYRTSQNKRLTVELALLKLCNLEAEKKKENEGN